VLTPRDCRPCRWQSRFVPRAARQPRPYSSVYEAPPADYSRFIPAYEGLSHICGELRASATPVLPATRAAIPSLSARAQWLLFLTSMSRSLAEALEEGFRPRRPRIAGGDSNRREWSPRTSSRCQTTTGGACCHLAQAYFRVNVRQRECALKIDAKKSNHCSQPNHSPNSHFPVR